MEEPGKLWPGQMTQSFKEESFMQKPQVVIMAAGLGSRFGGACRPAEPLDHRFFHF